MVLQQSHPLDFDGDDIISLRWPAKVIDFQNQINHLKSCSPTCLIVNQMETRLYSPLPTAGWAATLFSECRRTSVYASQTSPCKQMTCGSCRTAHSASAGLGCARDHAFLTSCPVTQMLLDGTDLLVTAINL